MKNKGRLGNVPKGLSWINEQDDQQSITQSEQNEKIETNVDIKQITKTEFEIEKIDTTEPASFSKKPQENEKSAENVSKSNSVENAPLTQSTNLNDQSSAAENGLTEGWTRATFIIKKEHLNKIKDLAWWERATIKEVMHDALKKYLNDKNINPRRKSDFISEEL